jgi:hypothetical protein
MRRFTTHRSGGFSEMVCVVLAAGRRRGWKAAQMLLPVGTSR